MNLIKKISDYLYRKFQEEYVSYQNKELADKTLKYLDNQLSLSGVKIVEPNVSFSDENVLFTWDRDEHHLEVEIENFEVSFFYRNRNTDYYYDQDINFNQPLHPQIIEEFKNFNNVRQYTPFNGNIMVSGVPSPEFMIHLPTFKGSGH